MGLLNIILIFWMFYSKNNVVKEDSQYSTVETASGWIRGKQNRTLFDGKLFYTFRGIPFGKPPINELRFKAPQPIDEPWTETFDAFDFGKDCYENIVDDIFAGHEDCLYLNVYVPATSKTLDTNAKLTVMFYIYGGRYVAGAANYFAPDFLLEENVIVVTFNYRLGPLGFLSLKLPEYSGNMGLKDQVLALKWVNENIGSFGGDNNKITLLGHSSGASSAHLLMISPQSKYLFQRAIMLSGSALCPYFTQRKDQNAILYELANELNYSVSNENELMDFINKIDVQLLLKKTFQPLYYPANGTKAFSHGWTFAIEDKSANDPFLTESVFNILTNSNYESYVDVLFSYSPRESVLIEEQKHPELLKLFDEVFEIDLPLEEAVVDFKTEMYKQIAKRMRDFYFDGKSINATNLHRLHMLTSDIVFTYGIDLSARIQAKKSRARTLFTKFTAENSWNWSVWKRRESNFTVTYDTHPDQLYYLLWSTFNTPPNLYEQLSNDSLPRQIIKNVAHFYADFAKFGRPEFEVQTSDKFKYYDITNDGIFVKIDNNRERFEFWDNLFNDFKEHWNITFDFHKLELSNF